MEFRALVWVEYVHVQMDAEFIRDNRLIQLPDGLSQIWFTMQAEEYYPVNYSLNWQQWQIWGPCTTGYHVVNLLLHTLTALLAWRLLKDLDVPGAWTITLLFAVHPVSVETAAWMVQQKTTLSALFWFASLACYVRFDDSRSKRWYLASMVLFTLGLLSKASVVTLPLALLVCCWWRRRRISRADLLASLPFFALALLLGLLASWFQINRGINGAVVRDDGVSGRLASTGWVVWFYLYKAVWPASLCFVYPRWQIDGSSWLAYLPGAALLLVAMVSWRRRGSWGHAALAALAYFVVALVPVSGVHDIGYMRYSLVADHWQYLALVAPIALVVGYGFHSAHRQPVAMQRGLACLAGLAVMVCSTLSWREAHHYQDQEALWTTVLKRNPEAWVAHNNLGRIFGDRKDHVQAEVHYREALRGQPGDPIVVGNLAMTLIMQQRFDEGWQLLQDGLAKNQGCSNLWYLTGYAHWLRHEDRQAAESLNVAIRLDPMRAKSRELLGRVLARLGDSQEAEAEFQQAHRLDPRSTAAHVGLARLLIARRQMQAAADHLRSALAIDPHDVDSLVTQANLLVEDGRTDEAIEHLRSAAKAQPEVAVLQAALGERLATIGRHEEARSHLQRALLLDPREPATHAALGDLSSSQGRIEDAIPHFQEALRLGPYLLEARKSLGGLLASQGRTDEAIEHYRIALASRPQWPAVATALAWLLATRSEPSASEQAEALHWAHIACRETRMQHPVALDTLAAAYAANGRLDKAADTAQQARDRAKAMGQAAFAQEVQQRLDDYNRRSARLNQ